MMGKVEQGNRKRRQIEVRSREAYMEGAFGTQGTSPAVSSIINGGSSNG